MSSRRVQSFLLRLVVHESDLTDEGQWRGRIQHVASGCEQHFEHLQELIAFINAQTATSPLPVDVLDEHQPGNSLG